MDKKTGRFFYDRKAIQISPKAFDILYYLIENQGRVIEKSALLEAVWNDSFVEESNLAVHVSAIRRIIREKHGEQEVIKTVSGRGYSFVAPVREIHAAEPATPAPPSADGLTLAVLPFTSDSGDDDLEFLASGVTQSLIDDLSKVAKLKVLAYSAVRQYRDATLDLPEIAFLLNADKLLTGHIHRYKNRAEISAELVNAADRTHLWGMQETFPTDDVFAVKREISLAIAENLRLQLTESNKTDLDRQKNIGFEAQKTYYRGKSVLESRIIGRNFQEIFEQALALFRKAIKLDPDYSAPYVGIGMVYVSLFNHGLVERDTAAAEVEKAFRMALAADDRDSQAYVMMASAETFLRCNLEDSHKLLDRALELNPNNPDAYHWKAINYTNQVQFDKALELEIKAVQLDPTSIRFGAQLMRIHYYSGDYRRAIVLAEEFLELDPHNLGSLIFLALAHGRLGLAEQALQYADAAIEHRPASEYFLVKSYLCALLGRKEAAVRLVEEVNARFAADAIDTYQIAGVYAELDDPDTAFRMIETAYERGSSELGSLKMDDRFRKLRGDPRYAGWLEKLKLA